METQPFDKPLSPGVRALWMLKFKHSLNQPAVDFFIPSPWGNNEWISANQQDNLKAQDMLGKIQKKCNELKSECNEVQKLEIHPSNGLTKLKNYLRISKI